MYQYLLLSCYTVFFQSKYNFNINTLYTSNNNRECFKIFQPCAENEPEQAEGGEEVDEESGGAAAGGFGGAAEVGELGVRSEDGQVRQGRGVHRRQADPRKEIRFVEC